jgi:glutathione-regulated potassium-efflux system ancillary protein KefG
MRILVLFAHPRLSDSIAQKALRKSIESLERVTIHDLYAAYPDFAIDVDREQELLLKHDLIVLLHPFYWYSSPAIIKEWLDLVLESGWAYGEGGTKLAGKFLLQAISTGGPETAYGKGGRNRFHMNELLAPFNQTAYLCHMAYLEPFVVFAPRRAGDAKMSEAAERYRDLIVGLRDDRLDPLEYLAKGYALPPLFDRVAA